MLLANCLAWPAGERPKGITERHPSWGAAVVAVASPDATAAAVVRTIDPPTVSAGTSAVATTNVPKWEMSSEFPL